MHSTQPWIWPLCLAVLLAGCASFQENPALAERAKATLSPSGVRLFDGRSGAAVSWDDALQRALTADVVVFGELHDSGIGHRFQIAFLEDYYAQQPAALCLEMVDRSEQPLLDAYLADEIGAKTFAGATDSNDIGGQGKWMDWYQPMIDAAKEAGAPVVATNAPRAFTGIARHEGFEALASFAETYPGQFVVPDPIEQDAYYRRFKDVMARHSAGNVPGSDQAVLESFFRAQQVWDATMADAVWRAWQAHGKAILQVGQFHVDRDGGLLLRLRRHNPDLKVFCISLQKEAADALRQEDRDRADIVMYPAGSGKAD